MGHSLAWGQFFIYFWIFEFIKLFLFINFRINHIQHFPLRSQFVNPSTGNLFKEGEIVRNPILADTLKRLALSHDPVQLFYSANGEIARAIVEEFGQNSESLIFYFLNFNCCFVLVQLLNVYLFKNWYI